MSLADQLRHVSWAEGFASASQPLPALPCCRFIAHQAMGVPSESQFWESPSFGLLQQINQVYQMVAALTMIAWWFSQVSVHSPANAASGTRTDL